MLKTSLIGRRHIYKYGREMCECYIISNDSVATQHYSIISKKHKDILDIISNPFKDVVEQRENKEKLEKSDWLEMDRGYWKSWASWSLSS